MGMRLGRNGVEGGERSGGVGTRKSIEIGGGEVEIY